MKIIALQMMWNRKKKKKIMDLQMMWNRMKEKMRSMVMMRMLKITMQGLTMILKPKMTKLITFHNSHYQTVMTTLTYLFLVLHCSSPIGLQ
jgi:hypothetical protein